MAKDSIGEWYEENLQPIFANVVDTLETSDADIIFQYITTSFIKNSVALLEGLKGYLRSYSVAQGMRLLMEFEADMDFLIKNPKNIPRVKKKVDKYRSDFIDEKKIWNETIVASGNVHLLDDATGEDMTTKTRVERIFDKDKYAFYCAYSHFNLYAICDDAENVTTLRDIRKNNWQRVELIKFYPVILDNFISSLNAVLDDNSKIVYDSAVFNKAFKKLLDALLNAKIRSQDV